MDTKLELLSSEERDDYAQDLLDNALDNLKGEVTPTGYCMTCEENDNMYEMEYWVDGLIESDYLDISLGGWFTVDLRDDKPAIAFLLALKIEDELIGECEGLQGWYDNDTHEWTIEWGGY